MRFIDFLFALVILFIVLNLFYHNVTVTLPVFGLGVWITLALMFGMVCELIFGAID